MRYSITDATIEQVKATGAKNTKQPRHIPAIFAELTPAQIQQLQSEGCTVTKVEAVKADVTPPTPIPATALYTPQQLLEYSGIEDLRALMSPPLYGENFNVAVIDTGIRETHEMIGGKVIYSKNYTSDPMQDGLSHGTAVAGIIHAVAPECNILNLKVLDNSGTGTEEEVVEAIDDCIDFIVTNPSIAPSVLNISLGTPDSGNPNAPLRVACRAAISEGIWVIASAGNGGPDPQTILSPACEQYVCAVGSVGYEPFIISSFSSRGPTVEGLVKPDVVMFGENISVASSGSDTATEGKSGTSFGTPFISGFSVMYQEGWIRAPISYGGGQAWGAFPELVELPSIATLIDTYLPLVSVKPQGASTIKDTSYGDGVILGGLVVQALTGVAGIDIMSLMMPMIMVMVMAMIIKMVPK